MRFEKKIRVPISEFPRFRAIINSFGFRTQYDSRYISSFYYDTVNFNIYRDSINGVSERKKYRVRFYNNNYEKLNLEEKIKVADLGYKNIYKVKDFKNMEIKKIIFQYKRELDQLFIPSELFKIYFPVSFINYFRSYFISYDGKVRITLDEKINYSRIINSKKNFSLKTLIPDKFGVIEIKYDNKIDFSKKLILKILSSSNFHLSRNSKYCNSIECLF